jgi:hypothetical protein
MMPLGALTRAALAQETKDARSVLTDVAKAMGVDGLKSVEYSGTGSSYMDKDGPIPAGGWPHTVMKSYVRQINLDATTSELRLIRIEGTPPVEKTVVRSIDANSPWAGQYEFWITPYGFLKGALANNATVETKKVLGDTYKAVSFTLPGEHVVVGYINGKNMVEKVETKVGDKDGFLAQAIYRDYTDFKGLKFPTLITEKHAGELALILVVKDVKPAT